MTLDLFTLERFNALVNLFFQESEKMANWVQWGLGGTKVYLVYRFLTLSSED